MSFFINNITDVEINQYKERTQRAINGINYLQQHIELVLECSNIRCRYKVIGEYMGLKSENGLSLYNYFKPLNANIIMLIRFSQHNNTNVMLYNQHETNGRPNKRYVIVFNGDTFVYNGVTNFLESEHHVIYYPTNALDNEQSVQCFLQALLNILINGETSIIELPIQQTINENKQTKNMKKETTKITESQLRQIIRESVETILNEEYTLGEPGSFSSGKADDIDAYTKSIAHSYKNAGAGRAAGNMDLYSITNGHDVDTRYFHSKKDAIDWVNKYITDENQAQQLIAALQQYIRRGGGRFISKR